MKNRDRHLLGKCFDLNLATQIPIEVFEFPACQGKVFSPCHASTPSLLRWPAAVPPSVRRLESDAQQALATFGSNRAFELVTGPGGAACEAACAHVKLRCDRKLMAELNTPLGLVWGFNCSEVRTPGRDGPDQPMMTSDGVCYTRTTRPTCKGRPSADVRRLCVCGA